MTSNSFGWQFITSVDEVHTWYLCFTCMTFNYSFIHSVSQPGGPRFNPWHRQSFKICVTFFPAEVHSAFHPFKVGKMSTSIHGLHDAAGSGGQYAFGPDWGSWLFLWHILQVTPTLFLLFGDRNITDSRSVLCYTYQWLLRHLINHAFLALSFRHKQELISWVKMCFNPGVGGWCEGRGKLGHSSSYWVGVCRWHCWNLTL